MTSRLRIVVLWQMVTGYLNACLQELVDRGHEVILSACCPTLFELEESNIPISYNFDRRDPVPVQLMLKDVAPDLVLTCSWSVPAYRKAVESRSSYRSIMYMDNQWLGTPKQHLARFVSDRYLHNHFDGVIYPGDRQGELADRLGFPRNRQIAGGISCDTCLFHPGDSDVREDLFLFVGRLSPEKGVLTLLSSYRTYREYEISEGRRPWGLLLVGGGELALPPCPPGVQYLGPKNPAQISNLMRRARVFVAPSLFEPWSVVCHEAVSSGLPIICTTVVGSRSYLALDGLNAIQIQPDSVDQLSSALKRIASMPAPDLQQMSVQSLRLAQSFSERRFADGLLSAMTW